MSLKIQMLKEDLAMFGESNHVLINGVDVTSITSMPNGDVNLSSKKKIGNCKKCGYAVYAVDNYHGGEEIGFCTVCNCNKTAKQID